MADDYGQTPTIMRRNRFPKEHLATARTFIIGEDGVRREQNLDITSHYGRRRKTFAKPCSKSVSVEASHSPSLRTKRLPETERT
jgi:hypothetical protein